MVMRLRGRQLNDVWSVGGSVKLQHHSVAGFSDSDLGVDIGVLVKPFLIAGAVPRWADRVTMGITVRNILEPQLRLANERVADPTGLRVGIAYRMPIARDYPRC